jgi:hypothetical protein
MSPPIHLKFCDTDGPVALDGCADLIGTIVTVIPHWRFETLAPDASPTEPFLTISKSAGGFELYSPFLSRTKRYTDKVDVMCSLIYELAWSALRANPEWLCVHGAAIEFAGRLVLFPNTRRAGKSTLTACLAADGCRVFTDDFLPIDLDTNGVPNGIACGAKPRLRLPVPAEFSSELRSFLEEKMAIIGHQYGYLGDDKINLAQHGDRLPFGAIVLLERVEGASPELITASKADVLRRIIIQNFSRAQDARRILQVLHFIASSVPLYTLRYSSAEEAASLLSSKFTDWPAPKGPSFGISASGAQSEVLRDPPTGATADFNLAIVRSDSVTELAVDDEIFLVDEKGYAIHHLDSISGAIWSVLEKPVLLTEVVGMFQAAFPDQPAQKISDDISAVVRRMVNIGLVRQADV